MAPTVVARARSESPNQTDASFAGALIMKGCPNAATDYPIMIQIKKFPLVPTNNLSQAPIIKVTPAMRV